MKKEPIKQENIIDIYCSNVNKIEHDTQPRVWLEGWLAAEKYYGIKRDIPISCRQGIFCPG